MNTQPPFMICVSLFGALALAAMASPSSAAPTAEEIALVNRVAWGADARSLEEIDRLGADRWLQAQLHTGSDGDVPDVVAHRIASYAVVQKSMSQLLLEARQQKLEAAQLPSRDARRAALRAGQKLKGEVIAQAQEKSILYSLNAPSQVRERMTWFWGNYFSVYARKADIAYMVSDYQDRALRPNALGRFRDLLEATLRHPAMQRYLDNAKNAKGRLNENYARELLELHTMGVGSGYTQKDVEELARVLTGVGINDTGAVVKVRSGRAADLIQDGLFIFNPDRHDFGDKVVLGHRITGAGYDEVREVLDILCREPATARHVTKSMATYFLGEPPSAALSDALSAAFLQSDGDIATVLDVLFSSKAFHDSLGRQFKPPAAFVYSAARTAPGGAAGIDPAVLRLTLSELGQGQFERLTPDGYPLESAAWSGPGQMIARFEAARRLGRLIALSAQGAQARAEAPADPVSVVWASSVPISAATRNAILQAATPAARNALSYSSPEFMRY